MDVSVTDSTVERGSCFPSNIGWPSRGVFWVVPGKRVFRKIYIDGIPGRWSAISQFQSGSPRCGGVLSSDTEPASSEQSCALTTHVGDNAVSRAIEAVLSMCFAIYLATDSAAGAGIRRVAESRGFFRAPTVTCAHTAPDECVAKVTVSGAYVRSGAR